MEVGDAESKFEKAKSSTSSMKSRRPIVVMMVVEVYVDCEDYVG